jgi:hypothetical protein
MSLTNRRQFSTIMVLGPSLFGSSVLGGCFLTTKSSKLEDGERVDTGRKSFDDYFAQVADLRDKVKELDSDLFPIRRPLVEEMDLDVDVALGRLLDETRKRVGKFKDYGITLSLLLRPTPKVLEERGSLEADQKDETLIKAIEESAVLAMQTFREYSMLLDQADALDKQRGPLADTIDKLPPDTDKGLVEREIVGAGRVLDKAEQKLLRDTRTLSHFLVGLVDAVDSGAMESHEQKCEDAIARKPAPVEQPKTKPKPRPWRPPPRPTGAGTPPPTPTPTPPRPRPKPGGDFEM